LKGVSRCCVRAASHLAGTVYIKWWQELGQSRYPSANRILITADCGGSNGARVRLWKTELKTLADQIGLSITFAFITQNCCGKPLLTHQVIIQLIASTTADKT
jgi:hypothetical protein